VDFDEEDLSPELLKQAEEEADRILAEGDPVEYILTTIQKKTYGGRENTGSNCNINCLPILSKHRGFADISKWRKWERKISWFKNAFASGSKKMEKRN
jgi:hypothetical protein